VNNVKKTLRAALYEDVTSVDN